MSTHTMQPSTRVLFIAHGRRHKHHDYGYLPLVNNRQLFYKHGLFVDMNKRAAPHIVMDVTLPCNKNMFHNYFDLVFIMAAPSYILKSKCFWKNVYNWLAPRGIVMSILPLFALRISRSRLLSGRDYNDKIKNWIPMFTKLDHRHWTIGHEHQYIVLGKN